MKLASFVVPHMGGTYTVYRSLRIGLASHGVTLRWLGVGPEAASVLQDETWADEHANGEVVASDADDDSVAARCVVEHLNRESYDGVLAGVLCERLLTNVVRYLPQHLVRLLLVHNITPGTYAAARAVRDYTHAVIAVAPRIGADLVRKYDFDKRRTYVVPNAVELTAYSRFQRININEALRIVFLGRLEESSKGIFWLPRILAALGDTDVRLTVAGDGPDGGRLREKCALLHDRITFLGRISPERVPEVLSEHDVFLMPSRFEGLPCTLLEAMAAGCVPVVSRIRGVTDTVVRNGQDGFLFPPGNVAAAAASIRQLAQDRAKLQRMSEAARRRVESRFSTDAMAAQYATILQTVRDAPPAIARPLPLDRWRYPRGLKPGFRTHLPTGLKNLLRVWRERLTT